MRLSTVTLAIVRPAYIRAKRHKFGYGATDEATGEAMSAEHLAKLLRLGARYHLVNYDDDLVRLVSKPSASGFGRINHQRHRRSSSRTSG